jgi:hypothetical protein
MSRDRQRLCRRLLTAALCLGIAFVAESPAASPPAAVPPDLQAAIFSRVLSFDRALKPRVGKTVTIGILFQPSNEDSKQDRHRMITAFDALEKTIQELPSRLVSHGYRDARHLGAWIDEHEVDVLYVTTGFEAELAEVRSVVADKKVVTLTPVREYVEQGLAIAVVARKNRPQVVVNLPATRAVGMDLDPKVLQLSDVIK